MTANEKSRRKSPASKPEDNNSAALENEAVPLTVDYKGKTYVGKAIPISNTCHDGVCDELDVTLNDEHLGIIRYTPSGWKMDGRDDQGFIDAIGEEIFFWYE